MGKLEVSEVLGKDLIEILKNLERAVWLGQQDKIDLTITISEDDTKFEKDLSQITQDDLGVSYPERIAAIVDRLNGLKEDLEMAQQAMDNYPLTNDPRVRLTRDSTAALESLKTKLPLMITEYNRWVETIRNASCRTRTCNHSFRRRVLYPIELMKLY